MKKKVWKKMFAIMAAAAMIVTSLTACTTQTTDTAPASTDNTVADVSETESEENTASVETVKIGFITPSTGNNAEDGKNQRQGVEMAVNEINEAGGIKSLGGAKIELIIADSQGNVEVGMSEAERLIQNEGVSALLADFESEITLPTSQVCEKYGVPFLVPSAIVDSITEQGCSYTFRTCIKAENQARDMIDFLAYAEKVNEEEIKTIGILYADTVVGMSMSEGWKTNAAEHGYEIIADVTFPASATDMSDSVIKIKDANPDAVLLLGDTAPLTLIVRQMRELGVEPKAVISAKAGAANPKFVENLGEAAENIFVVNDFFPTLQTPGAQEINEKFKEINGVNMLGNAPASYACVYVLADAIERAASTDRIAIKEALEATNLTDNENVANFLWTEVKFDESGQNIGAKLNCAQIQNGEYNVVWPEEAKYTDMIWPFSSK